MMEETVAVRGEDVWVQVLVFFSAAYVFWLWLEDWRFQRKGGVRAGLLPGAVDCPWWWVGVAGAGGVLLVGLETLGESLLGIGEQQQVIAAVFLLAMIGAAVVEELVFRGWLFVEGRGRLCLVGSVVFFSIVFGGLHPYLWEWRAAEEAAWWAFWRGEWVWLGGLKGAFSTAMVVVASLWFYLMRFAPWNPGRSLWPCFMAHLALNLTVFAVKWAQGFVRWF